ncbi:Probable replication-associated protein RepA1 (plasmid) [Buchnera aphidicola (Cinara pseudotaxifoliae)]|uniref:Probable replication-associated protein RepA1 n=1 Tax=Buchnera aphidicola (Cinara pseudotaxifoliae) TaxID=655384 RepID=A0A451DJ46_9GAMM|nr:plasmid replication initiator RepA [Buchnera aphidicola]VFP86695.1 Probable replication-associated protein RepA1 [Buchnera aphidicola (Cinara pseudotaxifoliae)]
MSEKKYVYNPYPQFIQPENHKKRPIFIRYAMERSATIDVAQNKIYLSICNFKNPITGRTLPRKRRLNEHRARALRAMVQAMLYHFNIASTLVMASVEKLSDACGLSTYSSAGNKSITRASRLITDFMEPIGLISCQKVWDKILGTYIPKIIFLQPLFFMLFNISQSQLIQTRIAQLQWINIRRTQQKKFQINLFEVEQKEKDKYIRKAFCFRNSRHMFSRQKKQALKIIQLEEKYARSQILKNLIKRYSVEELCSIGLIDLKRKVDLEYVRLRQLAQHPVP